MKDVHATPQAFPMIRPGEGGIPGMELRDYFAAQALGPIFAVDIAEARLEERPLRLSSYEDLAAFAYAMADAMLAAREQEQSTP